MRSWNDWLIRLASLDRTAIVSTGSLAAILVVFVLVRVMRRRLAARSLDPEIAERERPG